MLATHTLRGAVFGPDRAPRPHVGVWLVRRDAPRAEQVFDGGEPVAFTDHGGRFAIDGLGDGPYWLATAEPARRPCSAAVEIDGDIDGESADVELRQTHGTVIAGRVVDPEGEPVADAVVGIHCRPTDPVMEAFGFGARFVRSGTDGGFRLACLEDAGHTITVRYAGARDAAANAQALPGDDSIELVLPR